MMRDGFQDPEVFAKISLTAHDLYGFDNVMAGWGDLLVEAQAHGMTWKFPERDFYPRPAQYLDAGKVDELSPVDPIKDKYWSVPLKAASIMMERIGNEVMVMGCVDSPMLIACETIGMENVLMSSISNPDMVMKLVGTVTESCKACGEHYSKIGIDTVFCDNSSAGTELMSKESCERFDHHFLRGLMKSYDKHNIGMVLHNDSIGPYLDMQLDLGPKGLHFHIKSIDLASTFNDLKGRTTVFAGIDHQELLYNKTPEEISSEVERVVSLWGNDPGLVIASGCELPYKTPLGNIAALKDATIRSVKK